MGMPDHSDYRGRGELPDLKGTRTHESLRAAFANDAQAAALYRYFAKIADIEGYPEAAAELRELAESVDLYAHGHLDLLMRAGDPLTDMPLGETLDNLHSVVVSDQDQAEGAFPEAARTAYGEGFPDIASWFDTMVLSKRVHAARFAAALQSAREREG